MDEDFYIPKEVKAESFWGAIASLILFQIFGYCVFQAFIFYLDNLLMLAYGSIWIVVFFYFQSKIIAKIRAFLSNKSAKTATLSLRQIDEWVKFILTILFVVILISFFVGFYPFPQKEYDIFSLIAFYIFSWVITSIFSIKIEEAIPQTRKLQYQGSPLGAAFVGFIFVLFAYFFEKMADFTDFPFYLFAIAGLGFVMIGMSVWLNQDQIK